MKKFCYFIAFFIFSAIIKIHIFSYMRNKYTQETTPIYFGGDMYGNQKHLERCKD